MAAPRPKSVATLWPRAACSALVALASVGCSDRGMEPAASGAAGATMEHVAARAPVETFAVTQAALISAVESEGEEPKLVRLPDPYEAETAGDAATVADGPKLLPPESLQAESAVAADREASAPAITAEEYAAAPAEMEAEAAADELTGPTPDDFLAAFAPPPEESLLADVTPVGAGELTGAKVSERAQAKIRRAYELARRGANFAAREELVEALRMVAEAKDQMHGAARRTTALTRGLRALDEAADFCPAGADAEASLSVAAIVASHATPAAKSLDAAKLLPPQLADLYLRYAQVQLGAAVAGEPAGSMALHALGKTYTSLGVVEPEAAPLADRQAFALQHAALLARSDNNLAAHELGVMLAESGHYVEAEYMLNQVASREPNAVVYRNLAHVQRKLGRLELAAASEQQSRTLADAANNANVRWVPPQALAQAPDAVPPEPTRIAAGPPRPYAPSPAPGGQVQPHYLR